MAVLHKKFNTVFLGSDRIGIGLGDLLQHLHIGNVEFVAAGSPLVGTYFALDNHTRLLREPLQSVKRLGRDCILQDNALNDPAAIPKDREQEFPALAQVVEPASNGDGLSLVLADLRNDRYRKHRKVFNWVTW